MKNVPPRSVLVPAPFITDKVADQHLDENGQDAPAQHAAANAHPHSEAPFHIRVWRLPSRPPPPGSEEALEVWRQPQIIDTEDGIEVPAVWFDRRWHLQRPRTPPLLNISNERTRPLHPLPPENRLASPPYMTRRPPHRLKDLDDSSREASPITLPPSSATLCCTQCAAAFRSVGEGSEPFIILRCGHGFDRSCLEAIARPPPPNRRCGKYRFPHPSLSFIRAPRSPVPITHVCSFRCRNKGALF